MHVADRLKVLTESQTLAMTKKVRELKAEGKDILGLTLGEPDFDTPVHIRNAAIEAIRESFTHYTPVSGIPELREAVARKFQRDNGLDYHPQNVVVSTGAKQSLVNAIMCLVNPGEEVILPAPYWVSYFEMLKMADARIITLKTGVDSLFKITPEQLEAAITPKTRLFLLNSPSNPCGSMYSKDELAAIAEVLARHPQIYILSDEIYEYITYGEKHVSIGSFPGLFERTVTVNGFSKGFAMTGWRLGYIGAPEWIAKLCEKYQGQITSGANSIAQKAGVAALNNSLQSTHEMKKEFQSRRDFLYEKFQQIPDVKSYLPDGAFYLYPDVSAYFGRKSPSGKVIANIDDFTNYLLMEGHVATITGKAFGTDSHIRISYAYSMDLLKEGATRIAEALSKLK